METDRRTMRTSKGIREYTYLGCPLTRNRSAWCFRLCAPDGEGQGRCGRIAPHSLSSRIAESIKVFKEKELESHCEKLENLYLATLSDKDHDPAIHIGPGKAEIVVPVQQALCHPAGSVLDSIAFKTMADAAVFAVNSIVDDALVLTETFTIYLSHPAPAGELIARGRFLGTSGDQFLAEAVVIDVERKEIGRGSGAFVKSDIPLSADIGYA